MKQIVATPHTYNKTTGVIVLTGLSIGRDQLLLIVNTTRNVTYYNFADPATTLQAFTQNSGYSLPGGASTSITLNSSVISASASHSNFDALTIYYDDKSQELNELPYIKVNINVTNTNSDTLVSNVFLRRIGEYSYESIRYQGNEDEAYLKVILETPTESSQKAWRLYALGSYADLQGLVAVGFPQNAGSDHGDPFPPKTGWYLETGITGTLSISYEQPATQNVNVTNAGLSVSVSNFPAVATQTTLASVDTRLSNIDSDLGSTSESAATTDTATAGINGLLKRLLQRITTLIYPPFASGSFDNAGAQSSAIDCGGYDYLVQHITGGGGGHNRPIQWSNDNTSWVSGGAVFRYNTAGGSITTGANAHWEALGDALGVGSGLYVIPVVGRYWRIGAGASGGGGWTHNWYLHKGPFPGIAEEGIGARNSTAATTDTSDVGLNGLLKRLLQRLTTLLPANLTVSSTRLLVDGSGVTQPVSIASVPSHPVTGPLTDTQLRATAVPISGTVTANTGLTPLTDTQLRATAVPVSLASVPSHAVTGPLTNTELRATAVTSSVNNAGWKLLVSKTWNANQDSINNLDITGYSELAFVLSSGAGTNTTVEVLSAGPSEDFYWIFGDSTTLTYSASNKIYFTPIQFLSNLYVSLGNWDDSETQQIYIYGRSSTSITTNKAISATAFNRTDFTSTTPSAALSYNQYNRLGLTIYNEGPANLFVSVGATCTSTNYQVRLSAGDYWECPAHQAMLYHSAVFQSTGTARVTQIY